MTENQDSEWDRCKALALQLSRLPATVWLELTKAAEEFATTTERATDALCALRDAMDDLQQLLPSLPNRAQRRGRLAPVPCPATWRGRSRRGDRWG